jgi:hypothetical protein
MRSGCARRNTRLSSRNSLSKRQRETSLNRWEDIKPKSTSASKRNRWGCPSGMRERDRKMSRNVLKPIERRKMRDWRNK